MPRIALLVDGGHLRVLARRANKNYNPDFVEKIAYACLAADENLLRALYYDCAPFNGTVQMPVSGADKIFDKQDSWLRSLAARDLFAIRRGVLKFRGWEPKAVPIAPQVPTDDDFQPVFEQKGVDMRIGLDVAAFCVNRSVDRIVLITNDTDCVPAMKYARRGGIQTVIIKFPNGSVASELKYHSDYVRGVGWP
jgi:uncharacterized LabA/DUF88 family protein